MREGREVNADPEEHEEKAIPADTLGHLLPMGRMAGAVVHVLTPFLLESCVSVLEPFLRVPWIRLLVSFFCPEDLALL